MELLFGIAIGLIVLIAAVTVILLAPRSSLLVRVLALVLLLPIASFCVYGFLAAMEPGQFHAVWRIVYGLVFVACGAAAVRLLFFRGSRNANA